MTTTPSSSICAVTFSDTAPMVSTATFVPPVDVTPTEPGRKRRHVESLREKVKMLATFEELWASGQSFSPHSGPSSAHLSLYWLPSHMCFLFQSRLLLRQRLLPAWTHRLALPLPRPVRASGHGLIARLGLTQFECGPRWSLPLLPVVPSPVTSLVPGPVPRPRHLPARFLSVWGRPIRHPSCSRRVHTTLHHGGCRTACRRARGLGRLPLCRLPPRASHVLHWSLVRCWTLPGRRTLLRLHVGLLLLVRVPRGRGCPECRLVGRVIRGLLLGRLPRASLLLLTV